MTTATTEGIVLSKATTQILKNFAGIRNSILVEAGQTLRTIAPGQNIVAEATVAETFESPFAIWDLGQFLSSCSLFKTPTLHFGEKAVRIDGGDGSSINYFYSDPDILGIKNKKIKMPEASIEFVIASTAMEAIQKASSVLQLPFLKIEATEGHVQLTTLNKKDATSNSYSISIDAEKTTSDETFFLKIDDLKLLPGDYAVSVNKQVCRFRHQTIALTYWIAMSGE